MGSGRKERFELAGLVLATMGLLGIGGAWDAHWHWTVGRDSAWIPPHIMLYSGIALNGALAARMLLHRRRDPAAVLVTVGVGTVLAAAIFDWAWHLTFGDRMVWSPPHVLIVLGSACLGFGMAAAFIRAGRLGIISDIATAWGIRLLGVALLVAANFGQLPSAMLVLHPERADRSLLFDPTPFTLLTLLSGVMPTVMILALRGAGTASLRRLTGATASFWGLQQAFHLVLTLPVAAALGFAVKITPLLTWPFELAIFALAIAPLILIGSRLGHQPELAGAVTGAFYAVAVGVGLILVDAPARVTPAATLFSILLGTVSASVGTWLSDWIWAEAGLVLGAKPHLSR